MNKFSIYLLSFITFTIIGCNGQSAKNIKSIEAKDFSEKIKATPDAQIIDVRTPEEFNPEHIENAVNVDWNGDSFVAETEQFDKSKPVFVYCKSGGRSARTAVKLAELGFTDIYELQGGILKWNAAGLAKPSNETIGMSSQEFAELLNTDKKVLIDFYAEWCGPCKKMAPYLLKMQKEMADEVIIIKLDADKNKTLVDEMKIDALPTLILYQNKKEIWKNIGYISEKDLKKQLQ